MIGVGFKILVSTPAPKFTPHTSLSIDDIKRVVICNIGISCTLDKDI